MLPLSYLLPLQLPLSLALYICKQPALNPVSQARGPGSLDSCTGIFELDKVKLLIISAGYLSLF